MSRTKAERELDRLRRILGDTFSERRIEATGVVTEVVRERVHDASGQVLAGGKVRRVKFTATGLDDQTVAIPDGIAISTNDAILVSRSASRILQPDWQFMRVIRTKSALGSPQDAGRHVSSPVGFQIASAGVSDPTPGGNTKAWVQLTWAENPAYEGVAHYIVAYRVDGESVWHEIIDDAPDLLIRDLEVATTYNFRIRAVNGHGIMSVWSSVITYVTGSDATVPLQVASLTADFSGLNCVLNWDDNTEDDFSHYQIQIWDSASENTKYRDITRRTSSYTYTFTDNHADGGGTADPSIYVKVRAVDYTGNTGTWATVTATNGAPTAVTGLTSDWINNDLILRWTGPTVFTVPDLVYYRVRIYTQLGGTLLRDVGVTSHLGYLYTADMNRADNLAAVTGQDIDTSLYVILNTVDAFNQNSSNTTASPTKATPGAIQNLTADFSGSSLKLDWDDMDDPSNLDYYKVVITHNAGTTTFEVRNSYFEYTLNQNIRDNGYPADPSLSYAVSWVDKHGQESSASSGSATNTAPATPTGLVATGGFEQIAVTWSENSEDDLLGYRLYGSQSSGFTPGAGNRLWEGRGRSYNHAVGYQETWYYKITAMDRFVQESAASSQVAGTSHDINTATPGVPTSFALTSDIEEVYSGDFRGVIYATWNAPAGTPAAFQYELRWKLSTESVYEYKKTGAGVTNDSLHNLIVDKTYDVNIRTLSRYGAASAWYNSGTDTQITISNDDLPPPAGATGLASAEQNGTTALGDATARTRIGQGFKVVAATTIRLARVYMRKVGTPTDNLTVELQTDSGGLPSGTPVTNGTSNTVAGSSLTTSLAFIEFTFTTPPSLSAATQYHLVVKRSSAVDASNYYLIGNDTTAQYGYGSLETYNGTTWSADTSKDLIFDLSNFQVTAGTLKNTLTWVTPRDADTWRVLVYRNTSDTTGTAALVAVLAARPGQSQQYVDQFADGSNPFDAGTAYYYWLKFTDRAGNTGDFSSSETGTPDGLGAVDVDDISMMGWQYDGAWSASDYNTVSWASGTLRFSDGTSYSITGSNTGNMSALTYIYFDPAVSTTAFQTTTTAANAVGTDKVLLGIAQNNADTSANALYQVYGGAGGVAVTASKVMTSTLAAIVADMGTLTAGDIRLGSGTIGSNFTGVRMYKSGSTYRVAGYNNDTLQAYLDSDGKLYAAGGDIVMDATGLVIDYSGVSGDVIPNELQLTNSSASATYKGVFYLPGDLGLRLLNYRTGANFAGLRIYTSDGAATDDKIQFILANATVATFIDPFGGVGPRFMWDYHHQLKEVSAVTPDTGYVSLYAKTDGKLYCKDDLGTEYDLTASTGLPAGSSGQTIRHSGADWVASSTLQNDGSRVTASLLTVNNVDLSQPVYVQNPANEDTDGGRESGIAFRGYRSTAVLDTLASILADHDGTGTDAKGNLKLYTNDGTGTQLAVEIDSNGLADFKTSISVAASTSIGTSLIHVGDTDTYLTYNTDKIDLYAGAVQMLTLNETTQDEVVVNEGGADVDFRVEATGVTNALFVDGATGRVGIWTTPTYPLHVVASATYPNAAYFASASNGDAVRGYSIGTGSALSAQNSGGGIAVRGEANTSYGGYFTSASGYALGTGTGGIILNGTIDMVDYLRHVGDTDTYLYYQDDRIDLYAGAVQMLTLNETTQDEVVVNEGGADVDFRVEASGVSSALFVQGSNGEVAIGRNAPIALLDLHKNGGGTLLRLGDDSMGINEPFRIGFYDGGTAKAGITHNAPAGGTFALDISAPSFVTLSTGADLGSATNRLRIDSGGYVFITAHNSVVGDGSLNNSEVVMWVNESSNTLTFKVKYSTGTVKSGTVSLS